MLSALEQDLVNVGLLAAKVAAALVSANNPQYASSIATANSFSASVASALAPGSAAPESTLPADLVASIVPATSAVETILSKTASATQKATAVSTLIGDVEVVGADVWNAISGIFKAKAAPAAPASP